MQRFRADLNQFRDIKAFVNLCQSKTYDIKCYDSDDVHVVDCKSILGLFSLDLSQPILVVCYTDEDVSDLKRFEVRW